MNQYTGIYRRCELLFIRNELERFGLQPLEGKVLNFFRRGSCTQEDVCAHFDMEKGLVCRVVNEKNKRQKLVSLTAEGEKVLAETDKIFMRWDAICYSGFTEEERSLHQDFVRRIAENAMKYRHRQGGCTNDQ